MSGLWNTQTGLTGTSGYSYEHGLGGPGFEQPVLQPVLIPETFQLNLPAISGQLVGRVINSGGIADQFNIALVSPAAALGFFAIDADGRLTITPAGVSGLIARIYFLLVDAVNDAGFGDAVIMIEATQSIIGARDGQSRRNQRNL